MSKIIKLPSFAWSGNAREVEYILPNSWDVTTYKIAGNNRPAMTKEQMRAALAKPIESPRIKNLAVGKNKVVIIFDDLTRPVPTYAVLPLVFDELKEAGIEDSQIELICAVGMHAAYDRESFTRKLGEDVVAKYPVFNHVPFMNCTRLGKTSYGSIVEVNSEVMSCDLKIAIGGILPHRRAGFSGGGKIVMPGISSYEAISMHHHKTPAHIEWKEKQKKAGISNALGMPEGNTYTLDTLEMAKIARIDFEINCLVNHFGQIVEMFTGSVEPAYWAGVKAAKDHYRVTVPKDNDIVITNAFSTESEPYKAFDSGISYVKSSGGDIVLLANSQQGMVFHYLHGPHGMDTYGATAGSRKPAIGPVSWPANINHFIFFTEYPEMRSMYRFAQKDRCKVLLTSTWTEAILELMKWHPEGAKVAVFVDGTIQLST